MSYTLPIVQKDLPEENYIWTLDKFLFEGIKVPDNFTLFNLAELVEINQGLCTKLFLEIEAFVKDCKSPPEYQILDFLQFQTTPINLDGSSIEFEWDLCGKTLNSKERYALTFAVSEFNDIPIKIKRKTKIYCATKSDGPMVYKIKRVRPTLFEFIRSIYDELSFDGFGESRKHQLTKLQQMIEEALDDPRPGISLEEAKEKWKQRWENTKKNV